MSKYKIQLEPKAIFEEYRKGNTFKSSLGDNGIYEQTRRNERFYVGDQWHGAKCGNNRPLVRHNVIKRIGEYKMSVITAAPISVNYSADGVPNTHDMENETDNVKQGLIQGDIPSESPKAPEISVITSALSDYFKTSAERVKFDGKKEQILHNAYISGTGIAYTYWDGDIETGLYADSGKTSPIKGDIAFEVLDVENVNFGDPNNDDVQSQPYIIISQRLDVEAVKREAERNGLKTEDILPNGADEDNINSGDRGAAEPTDSRRCTVLTKFYKEYSKDGKCTVKAVKVTEKAYVKRECDLKITRYPIAKYCWERRRSSAYGESEVTYLIPNQIAINRALTAAVWGLMSDGMPIMLVNGDVVTGAVTNEPGQIIKVYGSAEETAGAIRYINPPSVSGQYQNLVNDLVTNTLSNAGANDAALGNLRPDNAAAIIQMREAATAPMQIYMNRFYDFIEDIARIWADMWLNLYGDRSLKIEDKNGVWYMPFKAERYRHLPLTARIDVGAATMWGDAALIGTLDGLLSAGIITPLQYLERLPKGLVPDLTGLIKDLQAAQQQPPVPQDPNATPTAQGDTMSGEQVLALLAQQYPEEYEKLMKMSPQEQQAVIAQLTGGMQGMEDKGL